MNDLDFNEFLFNKFANESESESENESINLSVNLSDVEPTYDYSSSMIQHEKTLLLSALDDYKKDVEILHETNRKLKSKMNVLEMRMKFYQSKISMLEEENARFMKKTKPNLIKRIWFYIKGKKYIIVK